MMRNRRFVITPIVAILAVALLGSACGRGAADDEIVREPRMVPDDFVPQRLSSEDRTLDVVENQGDETKTAFSGEGEKSLVTDGRLWEFRAGQRLVGVLQITTTRWELDLTQDRYRQRIVSEVMPAARRTINVSGVPVYMSAAHDKVTYLWFGEAIYQVLQFKGDTMDPESVLEQILDHQLGTEPGQWLFVEDEAGEEV